MESLVCKLCCEIFGVEPLVGESLLWNLNCGILIVEILFLNRCRGVVVVLLWNSL